MENNENVQPAAGSSQVFRILTQEELGLPEGSSSIPWVVEDPDTKERTVLDIGGQEEAV